MATVREHRPVWGSAQGRAALAILGITAVWRAVLLQASYFNQDDYYLASRAYHDPHLTWGLLFEPVAGHVMPAQQFVYWWVAHHAPFNWGAIAIGILAAQLVAVVVAWHLLTWLLPSRWVRLPLLAALAWSPLTLATTLWWSAAMGLWPQVIASLTSVLFLVRAHLTGQRLWNLLGCVVALVVGLLWHERAILTVVLLAGVAVCLSEQRGWRRLRDAVLHWWQLWSAVVVLCVGYLVMHTSLTNVAGGTASVGDYVGISWNFVAENALPGLMSGPWSASLDGGAVDPSLWVGVASGVLGLVILDQIVRKGGPARIWALVLLAVYVGVDLLLVLIGRSGFGAIIGLDPRYSSDIVAAAVICLALAFRETSSVAADDDAAPGVRSSWACAVAVGVTVAYGVGSLIGSAVLVPHFQNHDDRTYVENFRNDLAKDPGQVIVDAPVPADILLPLLGKEALLSNVFAPLPEKPGFDLPSPDLRTVATDGHLRPVQLVLPAVMRPGPVSQCGYAVKDEPRTITLERPVTGQFVLRLGYFTDQARDYSVDIGTWHADFRANVGPNQMSFVVPAQPGRVTSVVVGPGPEATTGGAPTLCVAQLAAGTPAAQ